MNKDFYNWAVTVTLAMCMMASAGCGGGSDDDGDFENLSLLGGTWQGTTMLANDTCSGATRTITFTHQVAQNGDAISLTTNNGTVFLGNTVANGFSVDAGAVTQRTCTVTQRIEYKNVDDNDDETADVELITTRNCTTGNPSCTQNYSGTASRTSHGTSGNPPANTTPDATPGVTNTPTVTGGCTAMNPKTVAGVYQGDGGCGLSETNISLGSQGADRTIILQPFGANGATSFIIDATNPAVAGSVRSDLTIKGAAGNSCSLACSPPGTFTVSCIVEGGDTCREKF